MAHCEVCGKQVDEAIVRLRCMIKVLATVRSVMI